MTAVASAVADDGVAETSKLEVACWAVLLAAAAGALIWKHSATFFLSWTDEQVHLYVAHRMAEGAILYRDIDSARPPLVLFPVAWLMRLGCSPLLAGRAMVLGTQLATGGLLLWGGFRLLSWRAGALAALLFLTSPEVFSRVHYTGIQLVALTASACVLLLLKRQPFRAGLAFGLSLAAGQHGLVVCATAALFTMARRPRDCIAFALGALAVSGIVFGGVWAMGGRHLWASLVGHHLYHLRTGGGGSAEFWEQATPWLYEHGYMFLGAGLGAALLGGRSTELGGGGARPPSSRSVRVLLVVMGAHLAVVLAMSGAVFLYVVVIAPLLALLAGMGVDAALSRWRARRKQSRLRARRASRLLLAEALLATGVTAVGWSAASSYRERLDESHYSFWPHLLHGQLARFQQVDLARLMTGESLMPREGTIFGDATIVTAVALLSGMHVSGELADLDPTWIGAGAVRREDVVSRIERDGVAAVITPPWFLIQDPYFRSYLSACYQEPKILYPPESGPGAGLPDLFVFSHIHGASPCQVPPR